MPTSEEKILKKLQTNYDNAIQLIPEKLRGEFEGRIIPRKEFEAFAPVISIAIQFQSQVLKSFLHNFLALRFSIDRFGRRLILSKIDPERVYSELLRGIFDT